MADVVLKNIKKVYPNIEPKKKKKGEPEKEKKNNLLVTEEGVLAVHDFPRKPCPTGLSPKSPSYLFTTGQA